VYPTFRSIEHFKVLEAVQELVEQREENNDRLKEKEAEVAYLKMICFQKLTQAESGSSLPINTHTAQGGSETD
jgi:hypothetical protein